MSTGARNDHPFESAFVASLFTDAQMPKNGCARGGQAPGAAPLNPLSEEWHVP